MAQAAPLQAGAQVEIALAGLRIAGLQVDPQGDPARPVFNSIVAVEQYRGAEMNAMVNPGAITATSMVKGATRDAIWNSILGYYSDFAGRKLVVNQEVYEPEAATNQRNQAIGRLMFAYGHTKDNPDQATDIYTEQRSVSANAKDLATMAASYPPWYGHDRVMADEYFRTGFTFGIWASGMVTPTIGYHATIGNNISTLGVNAMEDTRDSAYGASVWWRPTTGEFGPQGGSGDFEYHEELATRFGFSIASSPREDRTAQPDINSPTPRKSASATACCCSSTTRWVTASPCRPRTST